MNLRRALKALGTVILEEAEANPAFASRLESALGLLEPTGDKHRQSVEATKKPRARSAAVLDPHALLAEVGEQETRTRLAALSLDQLLDIVAEFVMDPSKLVMKWKRTDRLVDHIVNTAQRRAVKGDAFRS